MASFNIYGCCICRDLFGFAPYNTHEVIHFMQSSSPITNFVYPDKPSTPMTEEDLKDVPSPNFRKRCIMNDYNKTLLDCFVEKSDFFITDLIDIVNTNLAKETDSEGNEHYFTHSKWFRDAYASGLKNFFENKTVTPLHRLRIIEEVGLEIVIERYIHWLTVEKQYNENQVILIENRRTPFYFDGKEMRLFEPFLRDKSNKLLEKACRIFKEKCPGCHVIKMPNSVYSVMNHPWGLTDLHFCYEYYEYLYKCIDLIASNQDCKNELDDLFYDYSNLMIRKSIKEDAGSNLLKGSFSFDCSNCFIAKKGSVIYADSNGTKTDKKLNNYTLVNDYEFPYSKIFGGYVDVDACAKGAYGDAQIFGEYWKTVNITTCAVEKNNSIVLCHNGSPSKAHMNIIQTIEDSDDLYDKTVTLSVWARVLEHGEDKRGGVVAFINGNSYNKGKFYAAKEFNNKKWQQIVLTATLPDKENFNGLTICLRANAGAGEKPINAIVEFSRPKLEIGSVPTNYEE